MGGQVRGKEGCVSSWQRRVQGRYRANSLRLCVADCCPGRGPGNTACLATASVPASPKEVNRSILHAPHLCYSGRATESVPATSVKYLTPPAGRARKKTPMFCIGLHACSELSHVRRAAYCFPRPHLWRGRAARWQSCYLHTVPWNQNSG